VVVQVQRELGADIILTLDECTAFNVAKEYTEASMERSHRWELRYTRTAAHD
jgi:queuine tRNA-ribosyltransferase